MQSLSSQISSVTVFTNQAQITRTTLIRLEAGEHSLFFEDLPLELDEKSIQVSGVGEAILTNVKYQKEYINQYEKVDNSQLLFEKQKIEDEIYLITKKNKLLKKEKKFVENISVKITTPSKNSNNVDELEPEKWLKILDFYHTKIQKIEAEIWENEQILRPLQEKLDKTNFEINSVKPTINQIKNKVFLTIQMKSEGDLTLNLSYMVINAGWKPIYDLRVDTQTKKMNIGYNAVITQKTGENWENIKLKLSTAKPSISGMQPELSPWRINTQTIYAHADYDLKSRSDKPASKKMDIMATPVRNMMEQQFVDELDEDAMEEEAFLDDAMTTQDSVVDTKTTSVFFEIGGTHEVKSDNSEHKVTIFSSDFSAHFRYSCVPKLSTYAYLKAKVINNSAYPFLAGESNVFLDNNFIATSKITATAPSEEFWTFLGIDEGMKIEHKFLKKYETKESGFFSKKTTTWLYEYIIKIKNFKKTTEELVVWDQLPISENSTIKISLIEPSYKENTDKLKKNDYNYLEWFFNIKSSEEITIPFKFSVEYPNDKALNGI